MPTYEYRCKACSQELEVVQSFTDDSLTTCEACGGQLRKVFGNVGISFKGNGFYKNDSRGKSTAAASADKNGADKTGADKGSGDSGRDNKANGDKASTPKGGDSGASPAKDTGASPKKDNAAASSGAGTKRDTAASSSKST